MANRVFHNSPLIRQIQKIPLSATLTITLNVFCAFCLSMESIRLGDPAHGIMTKTVHKTLPGVVGSGGGWVGWVGGGGGPRGEWVGVVGSRGW